MVMVCVYSSPGSSEYIIPRLVTSVLILPSIAIYTQVNLSCLFKLCIYIKVDDLQLYTPVTIHIRVAAITNGMIRYKDFISTRQFFINRQTDLVYNYVRLYCMYIKKIHK